MTLNDLYARFKVVVIIIAILTDFMCESCTLVGNMSMFLYM